MGWSSGSGLMSDIIEALEDEEISYEIKVTIYKMLIDKFEEFDCDTLYECKDESAAFKEAYNELHPDEDDEEYWEDE